MVAQAEGLFRPKWGLAGRVGAVAQQPADGVGREPALSQKTVLAGTLGEVGGRGAELLAPDGQGAVAFGLAELFERGADRAGGEPVAGELLADAKGAVAPGAPLNEALDETLVGEVAGLLEFVEHGLELLGRCRVTGELALKLDPAVLAQSEQPQGPPAQLLRGAGRTRAALFIGPAGAQAASSADAPPRGATP